MRGKYLSIDGEYVKSGLFAEHKIVNCKIYTFSYFFRRWIESGAGKMVHSGIQQKNALHRR
jgi:hypothetical protein